MIGRPSPSDAELERRFQVVGSITSVMQGQKASFGVLGAYSQTTAVFTPDAAHFMQSATNVLVTAIERQRADHELRAREQQFQALVDNDIDLIARFGADLEVVYLNPAAERAVGKSLSSLLGRPSRELPVAPGTRVALELGIGQVFQTGRTQLLEIDLQTPSGDRHYQLRLSPELSDTHSVEYVMAVARDITDLQGSQQEHELLHRELVRTRESLENMRSRIAPPGVGASVDLPELSRRERQILRLVAEGLTNQAVGARLSISAGTVKNHLRNVLPKLNAVSRSHAVARAVELGLISRADPVCE